MVDAVYARQSVDKKNSISIEGQIDLCRRAAGRDLKVYKDKGFSGKNTERPAFKNLIKDIESGKIGKLYVYRLDRFSRSVADFGRLWEILKKNNVEFVSVNENFDTTTPMGRAMLHIIMVFAQLERETTAERVKDNYYRRASLGSWPGGPAPYGYENSRTSTRDGRQVPSVIPGKNSEVVIRIFEEYAKPETTLGSLAKLLNKEGISSAKRSTWDNVALSRVLHCPTYVMADEQVYLHYKALGCNVTSPIEDFDGVHSVLLVGKREANERKYTNVREHSVSILNSVGIIPADLWLKCQNKLANNRQLGNSGRGKHTWLTGLIKCGNCGYSLKVNTEGSRKRFVCSGRYNLSKCDATVHVQVAELEEIVSREIEKLLSENVEVDIPAPEENMFKAEIEELDRRAERLLDAFAESDDLSSVYLKRALKKIDQERQALVAAKTRQVSRPSISEKLEFSKMSFDEKKLVAAQFVNRINVFTDSAEIVWNI